jgi:diadenosine tetraphosphate (Ap4A) HIT family hydrolase
MTETLEQFRESFQISALRIVETEHWIWSLRPQQPTLGSGIISLKTSCHRFSDLPDGAGADLQEMVRIVEGTLLETFAYQKINYLMLMMVDAQLHMHVIPRYADKYSRFGLEWADAGWPKAPDLSVDHIAGRPAARDQLLCKLATHRRSNAAR